MKICPHPQYSPEWWAARERRMTASRATAIGNCGKGLETYIDEKMSEYYSSAEKEHFSNKETERGLLLEPVADTIFKMDYAIETRTVGFVIYNDFVGCSPDRFTDADGLVEYKCPNDKTFWILKKTEKVDSGYVWQMNMQMLVCDKKYCHFVAYNPNFSDYFFTKRFTPDPAKVEKLKKGFEIGEKLIREADERYKQ